MESDNGYYEHSKNFDYTLNWFDNNETIVIKISILKNCIYLWC